jgi:hypothetical protein
VYLELIKENGPAERCLSRAWRDSIHNQLEWGAAKPADTAKLTAASESAKTNSESSDVTAKAAEATAADSAAETPDAAADRTAAQAARAADGERISVGARPQAAEWIRADQEQCNELGIKSRCPGSGSRWEIFCLNFI